MERRTDFPRQGDWRYWKGLLRGERGQEDGPRMEARNGREEAQAGRLDPKEEEEGDNPLISLGLITVPLLLLLQAVL